jgi:hypothetical protein
MDLPEARIGGGIHHLVRADAATVIDDHLDALELGCKGLIFIEEGEVVTVPNSFNDVIDPRVEELLHFVRQGEDL